MAFRQLEAEVTVTLKPEVLDPEARAIQSKIEHEFPKTLRSVDTSRVFRLSLDNDSFDGDLDKAESFVDKVCSELLVNPVSETYSIRIFDSTED